MSEAVTSSSNILLVDDDVDAAQYMASVLRSTGHTVDVVDGADACLDAVRRRDFDVVVTDHNMPGMTGAELCRTLKERHPDLVSLLLTAHTTVDVATEAIQAGAYDFLTKPVSFDALAIALARALEHQRLRRDVTRLRATQELHGQIPGIVGDSRVMIELASMIRRVASTDATILITGESGTGKELVARALHQLSARANEPFLAINCGAMPPNLLESELFGHETGAFTDATARVGLFIQARRGTVFLDEIGEMPLEMQVKLLRVLQERKVRRVGADTEVTVEARVITATNRDLESEVEAARFREDLFHRVNVVPIEVPSLRDRRSDIMPLAEHMLARIAKRTGKPLVGLDRDAARRLIDYRWPGNVRELENSLERAVAITQGRKITANDLPPKIRDYEPETFTIDTAATMPTLEDVTKGYVRRVLDGVNGNKSKAARMLGITRRSLYRRI